VGYKFVDWVYDFIECACIFDRVRSAQALAWTTHITGCSLKPDKFWPLGILHP
jgi:hypothetical protein